LFASVVDGSEGRYGRLIWAKRGWSACADHDVARPSATIRLFGGAVL
jgi:hypothetical protein